MLDNKNQYKIININNAYTKMKINIGNEIIQYK